MGQSVRANVLANLGGRAIAAIANFAAVPLYLKYLGVEAWGLVTLFATLQSLALVLDLGLSLSLNRELALSSGGAARGAVGAVVRACEIVYWALSVAAGAAVFVAAPWLTRHWINLDSLSPDEAIHAFQAMGAALALQLPAALYSGGLLGLQRQVGLSAVTAGFSALRALGGIGVVAWIAPSPALLMGWQAACALVQSLLLAVMLRRAMPADTGRVREGFALLRREWRFALGANLLSILGALLLQADKLVLAKLLPLDRFGAYALASLGASLLSQISGPVFAAYQPRLTQAVGAGDAAGEVRHYHRYAELMMVAVIPFAVVGALYAEPLLMLWTHDPTLARTAAPIFAVLTLGWGINALATVPGTLQIAHGITGFGVRLHAVAILGLAAWVAATVRIDEGGQAALTLAAAGWGAVNLAYLGLHAFVGSWRFLPPAETLAWLRSDLGLPGVAIAVVAVAAWMILPSPVWWLATVVVVGLAWAVAALAGALAGRSIRAELSLIVKRGRV